ncbi:MAG: hypothetical protein GIKADHBN_02853 [Phycisphaerales bacterium]|nr:hypothetical protein [Phycisphaerales bacterium]
MKKLLVLLVLAIVLVIAAVVALFIYIDSAVKVAVERGGTYAMGVPTTLGDADVGIMSGSLELKELKIANPPGGKSDRFFGLGDGKVAVSLASLRQPIIEVPTLALSDIVINLERTGDKANYQVILDNLKRLESGGGTGDPRPGPGEEKRFVVNQLTITNVKVHVDLLPAGGQLTQVNIPIDSVELQDVGTAGKGVPLSELANIIVKALLAVVTEKGGQLLPAEILGDLKAGLAQLQDLDQLGVKLQSQLGAEAQKQIDAALQGVQEEANKAIDDAAKKVEDKLKDLLPGKK